MANIPEEALLALAVKNKGGGGGGTTNYNDLDNQPQIGGVTLVGNKSASDLGLADADTVQGILDGQSLDSFSDVETALADKVNKVNGKGLSTNDYDDTEKGKNADNATAIAGMLNGSTIDSFADVETALANKQDTLTFDNAPTENSNNPVKSGGVYSALAGKQGTLTAGNYISIANDGTISVTQSIGVYDVYSYEIKSINSGYATKITKRKNGVFVSEQDISNGAYSSENRLNVDNRFEFWYTFAGYLWHYKLLVDSNEHQKDEEVSWQYSTLVDYTETFNVSQDSSTDLATKGDVNTALAAKQDTLTFDDVPTANSNNPVKSGGVKSAIDAAVSSAYHHAGTKTCAELVAGLLVAGNEGNVYNMTDSGTTTADFIEGAGQPIKAGDNVGIAKISDGGYKFDLLSGFVDTSNFVQKSETAGLLQNDGTVNTTIEGDVATLKSGLTTLDTEVNGDAVEYPYADVITIEDAVPSNLADCSVKIEPVQDLHGYDKPWVGGAGKNKLPMTVANIKSINTNGTWSGNTYTINDRTFELIVSEDTPEYVNAIKVNGNFTSDSQFGLASNCGLSDNSYILSGGHSSTKRIFFYDGASWFNDNGSGVSFTLDSPSQQLCTLVIKSGENVSNELFYPMLRLATETDATFAPYTNICPITGHTESVVTRTGKNLCIVSDKTISGAGYVINNDLINNTGGLSAGTYTVSFDCSDYTSGAQFEFIFRDSENQSISSNVGSFSNNRISFTVTIEETAVAIRMYTNSSSGVTISNIQIELGSTATTYEPYAGKTYTIQLGDTIYGGTVDFDSGVMTASWKLVNLGSYYWGKVGNEFFCAEITDFKQGQAESGFRFGNIICSDYDGTDHSVIRLYFEEWRSYYRLFITDPTKADMTEGEFKTAMDGVQLCYELATPTTIQLTPQQIQLLKGTNTLTASTGQISVTVNGVSGAIGSLTSDKQDKTDYALETTDKTVVGAINEVNSSLSVLENIFDIDYRTATINLDTPTNSVMGMYNGENISGTTPFTLTSGTGHLIMVFRYSDNMIHEVVISGYEKKMAFRSKKYSAQGWVWNDWVNVQIASNS